MGFLDKLAAWLEKHFLPIAGAIGRQKHLAAMRDGFIAILPMTMMGALVVMLNNVLFNADSLFGKALNKMGWYADSVQPFLAKYIIPVMSQIWWGTLALGVIFSVFTISYNLAKNYEVDGLSAGVIATVSYLTLLPQTGKIELAKDIAEKAGVKAVEGWGLLSWTSFNSSAVFTGLITAILATEIYRLVIKKGWVIKMPEQVPPAVSKAFSAVIPGGIVMLVFGILSVIFLNFVKLPLKDWIDLTIQRPLTSLGQSPATMIFLVMISQILWFFGLHGMNIVGPILDTMYAPAIQENLQAVTVYHTAPTNAITRNFIDVYAMHGGSGATLGLIICIYLFSKRQEHKELAKLATAPGIFQINEPVIYGLPMVLNPLMFIPFVLTPVVTLFIAWLFTGPIPFAGKIYIASPWVTPPIVSAFLSTGGSITATILAAVTLLISILIYAPFVIVSNKDAVVEESGNSLNV
ncbi:PTS sugar transporter subunit IIC [Clostridium sp. YIM B02515]|uniref:Permease IIC component n=1 Tax=Clostridium rhizosphaerae TaxID=2803861 RepID=A0ABS1TA77_9CLOT|nr:PTS transporter subunit EIIC [Clostridium rhizosphaerae]MBL4936245.1 PTS sugar transporter subunit IIC [Clostridium rhizosphaerae]